MPLLKRTASDRTQSAFKGLIPDFLRQLAPGDRATIELHLEPVSVSRGEPLLSALDAHEHIYFPQGPLISLEQANRVEVALVGSEGLVGWPALVGCRYSPYHAMVRGCDGIVLKIRTSALIRIAFVTPSLAMALSRFVNVIGVQMAETIGAYAYHRTDMRLARWLLLRHDRLETDDISVNHDEIAENLGTRRASITDCLHVIEGDGLVRCRRGRITIRDRMGLEALATGCYGAAESFYRDIIGASDDSAAVMPAMKW
jgi:CRP-like cAMP-binding protein